MPGERGAPGRGQAQAHVPADRGYRGTAREASADPSESPREALGRVAIDWVPRDEPLVPVAVAARGAAARALALRLARIDAAALARLAGVAGPGLLIALGAADALPWVDGVVYLGRDPGAPSLLLPTVVAPSVPVALLERALLVRAAALSPPLAVLVDPSAIVGVGAARPIVHSELTRWIEAHAAADGDRPW